MPHRNAPDRDRSSASGPLCGRGGLAAAAGRRTVTGLADNGPSLGGPLPAVRRGGHGGPFEPSAYEPSPHPDPDRTADHQGPAPAPLGPLRDGVTGFRRSHSAALAAQRLLADNPDGEQLTAYRDIEAVVLASQDQQRMGEFITSTLGALRGIDPAQGTLRTTLRVYLDEGGNAARTAARLHTHRNTVLHRIARAEALLGYPVAEHRLAVSLALELLHHLGDRALRNASQGCV